MHLCFARRDSLDSPSTSIRWYAKMRPQWKYLRKSASLSQMSHTAWSAFHLLSGDRANTHWPLNAPTKRRYVHTCRGLECLCWTLRFLKRTLSWRDTKQLILCAPLRKTPSKTQFNMCFCERLRTRHRKHSVLVKDSDSEKKLILKQFFLFFLRLSQKHKCLNVFLRVFRKNTRICGSS